MASFNRSKILEKALIKIDELAPKELVKIHLLLHSNDLESHHLISHSHFKTKIDVHDQDVIPTPGRSRNLLLKHARTQWVCFLDDDVIISDNYFQISQQILNQETCHAFGGPDQAFEGDMFQKTAGNLLESSLVMGTTNKRHSKESEISRDANELMLTLCNFWIDKSWLESKGLSFAENLLRCEENLLIDQMKRSGAKLFYFPQLYVYHLRRTKLNEIFHIQLKSGFYRGVELNQRGSLFKPLFLIPLVTGFCIIFLPILSPSLFVIAIKAHILLNLYLNLKILLNIKSPTAFAFGIIMVILIHTGFSLGMVVGWMKGKFYVS